MKILEQREINVSQSGRADIRQGSRHIPKRVCRRLAENVGIEVLIEDPGRKFAVIMKDGKIYKNTLK